MLPPHMLVKGNSWIEGLTVFSIILGTVLGGLLISSSVSTALLSHSFIGSLVHTPPKPPSWSLRSSTCWRRCAT